VAKAKRKVKPKPRRKVKPKPRRKVKPKPKRKVKVKPGWRAWTLPGKPKAPEKPIKLVDDDSEDYGPDYPIDDEGSALSDDSEDDTDYEGETDYMDIDWDDIAEDYDSEIPFEWFSELS
jgi:hypothetical protein